MSKPNRLTLLGLLLGWALCHPAFSQRAAEAPQGPSYTTPRLGENISFYQYTLRGRGLEEIKEEAMRRAVATTVGTFMMEDRFLLAPELLDAYLGQRIEQFVAGVKILETNQGVGTLTCNVQVAVDRRKLETDLAEKRFFYEPKRRPYFHVSLAERVEGSVIPDSPGRDEIIDTLREMLARPTPFDIVTPSPSLDVEANQDVLYQALIAARRHGIEVILTGSVAARQAREERLYYDDYVFYDAEADLKLVRVQDGEILRTERVSARAGDPNSQQAAANAIRRATRDATLKLLDGFFEDWRRISLNEGDYRILVTDINESQLEAFLKQLSALREEIRMEDGKAHVQQAKVYLKSFVNGVAVINLYFSGSPEQLQRRIRESRYPRFTIDAFDGRYVKLSRLQS